MTTLGERINRRRFLRISGTTAATTGSMAGERAVPPKQEQRPPTPAQPPRGAAINRVRFAIIGFGASGSQIARNLLTVQGAEIAAVADVYDGRHRRAREIIGDSVQTGRDWRAVLDRPDVDAVIVATPDHLHSMMVEQAIRAGKDVYCECPVVHRPGEGDRLEAAAAERKRIVQAGGGWISSPVFGAAREMIAAGRIGRVTLVRGTWDSAGSIAAWQVPFPPDASPDSIDFAAFQGDRGTRPFDPYRFFRWRCYRDYGSGLSGARFAPQLTAIHWLLGAGIPSEVTASGSLSRWKDGREVPDSLHAVLTYPQGFVVILSSTQSGTSSRALQLVGTDGTLLIDERGMTVQEDPQAEAYPQVAETWPKEYRDWFYMMHGMMPQGQVRGTPPPQRTAERFDVPAAVILPPTHIAEFVDCVRTRRQPKESLELGLQAAAAARRADDMAAERLPAAKGFR
jgi:predicted dehydrogenase